MLRTNDASLVGSTMKVLEPRGEFYYNEIDGIYGTWDFGRFYQYADGEWTPRDWNEVRCRFKKQLQFLIEVNGTVAYYECEPKRLAEAFHKMLNLPSKRKPLLDLLCGTSFFIKKDVNQYSEPRFFYDVIDPATNEPLKRTGLLPPLSREQVEKISELPVLSGILKQ
jgi:hypothetical protein